MNHPPLRRRPHSDRGAGVRAVPSHDIDARPCCRPLGVNIGVFAVTTALSTATVGAGWDSACSACSISPSALDRAEPGRGGLLLAALSPSVSSAEWARACPLGIAALLIAAIILALAVADSAGDDGFEPHDAVCGQGPPLPEELATIERRTDMKVREVSIVRLDYVNDSTMVDVRCSKGGPDPGDEVVEGAA